MRKLTESERIESRLKKLANIKKWQKENPLKFKSYRVKYVSGNRTKVNDSRRLWYSKNATKLREQAGKWRLENPEKVKLSKANVPIENLRAMQKRAREKMMREKGNRLIGTRLRLRFTKALKRNSKKSSALVLLGCSLDLFRLYLQNQFRDGMAWNNYGSLWHIDHIKPCAAFDLSKPEEQAKCFHYSNMQPLLAIENMKKGDKYEQPV